MTAVPLTAQVRHENEAFNKRQAEARRVAEKAALLNGIIRRGSEARTAAHRFALEVANARFVARGDADTLAAVDQTAEVLQQQLREVGAA